MDLTGPLGNRVELGVHIADVSYFVAQGSRLDEEASRKGNHPLLSLVLACHNGSFQC